MTNWPTREWPLQVNEEPPPRHRNAYDYDGEYEFCIVQHWSPECPTEQLRLAKFSGFGSAVAQAHSLGVMRLQVLSAGAAMLMSLKSNSGTIKEKRQTPLARL